MLNSMTGYGKATGSVQSKKISVEIRSLNSKSLDLNTRIANAYKELEGPIRKLVAEKLGRGKIDFTLSIDSVGDLSSVSINTDLAKLYHQQLKALSQEIGESSEDYLSLIMRMPEIFESTKEELTEEEASSVMEIVGEAIDNILEFRRKEGKELEDEFGRLIAEIRTKLNGIPQYEDERITTIKERMKKALEELDGTYDDNRFEQELIFYIEKLDVSEEKMRLANHLDYFEETMKLPESGKKLGFIGQEIGREINTLGSKSNHAEMQKLVIGMKDALEKIKEQVLNTL